MVCGSSFCQISFAEMNTTCRWGVFCAIRALRATQPPNHAMQLTASARHGLCLQTADSPYGYRAALRL